MIQFPISGGAECPPRRRILCVEDDEDTCELITAMLGQASYEVDSAKTVAEGLDRARGDGYSLYLLDRTFSDGTGIELCEKIRQFDAETPIVFFSGLAQESDRARGLVAGAQAYLIKPNDIGVLADTIERLIEEMDGASGTEG